MTAVGESSQSRQTPSRMMCSQGAPIAIANAQRLLRCAKHLGDLREFGPGSSLLVLAAEEATKAAVLAEVGAGIPVPQKALLDILYEHEVRHATAMVSALMGATLSKWIDLMLDLTQRFPDTTTPEFKSARKDAFQELLAHVPEAFASANLDWWAEANARKNSGLYVDFNNGRWFSPSEITEADFEKSLRIVEAIVESAKDAERLWDSIPEESKLVMIQYLKEHPFPKI